MSKTNVATNSEPGIIGQMYEDRKSKKRGVLESRETKYKTLMFRADDGSSFNITYATFRSNWRKYVGDEIIQTSTQVEEQKTEEKKREQTVKKTVESKSEVVKMTTEEKIKKLRAIDDVLNNKISNAGYNLKAFKSGKGGIIIRFATKKTKLIDVWYKFNLDRYEFVLGDAIFDAFSKELNKLVKDTKSEYVYKETWTMKHQYKVSVDNFNIFVDALLGFANTVVEKIEATKKKEEK